MDDLKGKLLIVTHFMAYYGESFKGDKGQFNGSFGLFSLSKIVAF
jgi:hypothetical protein